MMPAILACLSLVLFCLAVGAYARIRPKCGKLPEGERLARIEQSRNYVDGEFQNMEPLMPFTAKGGYAGALVRYLFSPSAGRVPPYPAPTVKTDLLTLDANRDVIVWLGHASYFIRLGGKSILIDPVFSEYASPVFFANKAFPGANVFTVADLPEIDYLLISHDHWDHLDYPTAAALKPQVRNVVSGLGVGAHFAYWGYSLNILHEKDWFESLDSGEGLSIHVLPARHYSGRLLARNKTLWASFALTTPDRSVFFSGDSGYGSHFAAIGRLFSGFDAVMLDSGQYDAAWRTSHMTPEDALQAAEDLNAQAFLPAHVGKFAIAYHPWDEPCKRLAAAGRDKQFRLVAPIIGEPLFLHGIASAQYGAG